MALLPESFALPPLAYLAVLVVAVLAVAALLYAVSPPVTERTVLALGPWMVLGSALYVLYQIDAVPPLVAPFFGSPTVYATTFVLLGALWAASSHLLGSDDMPPAGIATDDRAAGGESRTTATVLGVLGGVLALVVVSATLWVGADRGSLVVVWPTLGLIVSLALAAVVWALARRSKVGLTGWAGALVVFSHALDGVSTAIGVDVLGFGEQTPLARVFLEVAASLPVAGFLGTGWLFIAVKIALAVIVAWLLADSVRERPREGYLLCAFVAAVGLGPGAHNLLLFAVAG
ncbi:DUF63 domain-containing protein [Halobacteriales archaeon QS_3_64_16]|nr:MAG: DUF63 domain-containing protein [Halobacteriales archaeon QS_3_64_16]